MSDERLTIWRCPCGEVSAFDLSCRVCGSVDSQPLLEVVPVELLRGVEAEREEAKMVNEQLLGEREGVRARRPDLTVREIDELLRPEDALPDEHSEWRLKSAKEKLRKARHHLAAALGEMDR